MVAVLQAVDGNVRLHSSRTHEVGAVQVEPRSFQIRKLG